MLIKPYGNSIIVQEEPADETDQIEFGIVIPNKYEQNTGYIIASVVDSGSLDFEKGTRVLISKYVGTKIRKGPKQIMRIIYPEDVLALVEDEC